MKTACHYLFILCALSLLSACSTPAQAAAQVRILPENCTAQPGEQIALTLDGKIPSNVSIQWDAAAGEVVWAGQGLTAAYLAPDSPGQYVITVSFTSGTPSPLTASLTCTVTAPPAAPTEKPPSIPPAGQDSAYTIAISEVMGNPCGGIESRHFNQYVELYNYGEQPVDVNGWWIYDEGEAGTPDQITAWSARSTTRMDAPLVTNSTVIPPHGFGVVLAPIYTQSYIEQRMPYQFPAGTVILTIAESDTLGDSFFGIISDVEGRDTLTLYIGGATVIQQVIDTYGTPSIKDNFPIHIEDNRLDAIPLYQHECESVQRINPRLPDAEDNWTLLKNGSPGEGPY